MSKLKWTPDDVFGLPGLSEKWKYAAIDESKIPYVYIEKPVKLPSQFVSAYGEDSSELSAFDVEYAGSWEDSLIERPVEIKAGVFGFFSGCDSGSQYVEYGYIKEIDRKCKQFPLRSFSDSRYSKFKIVNPATLPEVVDPETGFAVKTIAQQHLDAIGKALEQN